VTYDPWKTLAAQPDLTMLVTRLPAGQAWWLPDERGIVLDDRLGQVERRCALEHELQHAAAGDTCCDVGPDGGRLSRRQERRTDDRAAQRLISIDELADALVWCLGYDELAEHLHVDERTVRARIRTLTDQEKAYIDCRIATREGAV
jgi:hypothetical protein